MTQTTATRHIANSEASISETFACESCFFPSRSPDTHIWNFLHFNFKGSECCEGLQTLKDTRSCLDVPTRDWCGLDFCVSYVHFPQWLRDMAMAQSGDVWPLIVRGDVVDEYYKEEEECCSNNDNNYTLTRVPNEVTRWSLLTQVPLKRSNIIESAGLSILQVWILRSLVGGFECCEGLQTLKDAVFGCSNKIVMAMTFVYIPLNGLETWPWPMGAASPLYFWD
ncbi:hypothetical protein K1719_001668 [Acacia pycnantha]|nr:hypothetical protein K1719_001668 [Acacia pycnantha]